MIISFQQKQWHYPCMLLPLGIPLLSGIRQKQLKQPPYRYVLLLLNHSKPFHVPYNWLMLFLYADCKAREQMLWLLSDRSEFWPWFQCSVSWGFPELMQMQLQILPQ